MATCPDFPRSSIEAMKSAREELTQLFSQESIVRLCRDCKDNCCKRFPCDRLSPYDLFYCAAIGFEPPEPDWELQNHNDFMSQFGCLFLARNGCILKENRRLICLGLICPELQENLMRRNQYIHFLKTFRELEEASKIFCFEILKRLRGLDETTKVFLEYYFNKLTERCQKPLFVPEVKNFSELTKAVRS